MAVAARSISETAKDEWGQALPLLFRSYGEWKSPVYIYTLIPFIKIFGNTELAVRLPSALAGILAVYLTYLIASSLYGRKVGLSASLLLAISPWHLLLSRPAFEANLSLTLILCGLYFFLSSLPSFTYMRLGMSAFFFGLAPHTYNSAKVFVPMLACYLILKTKLYTKFPKLLLYLTILATFALPLILELYSGRAQYRYTQVGVTTDQKSLSEFVNYRNNPEIPSLIGKLFFNRYTYTLHATSVNIFSYLNPSFLLLQAGDHHQHHVEYFGVLYFVEFLYMLYGLIVLSRAGQKFSSSIVSKTEPLRYLPVVIILLGILPAAVTRDQGHVLRSILTLPGWQILSAIGFIHAPKLNTILKSVVILFFLGQVTLFTVAYYYWYPIAFARDWQYGHKEVAAFLREHAHEYDHIIMTKWFGEPQLFLAFYNNWDMGSYQKDNLPNLRYEQEGKLWLDQLSEYSIGKYEFKYLDYSTEKPNKNTLYIGKFDDFSGDPKILKTVTYPDGSIAFVIVEGKN